MGVDIEFASPPRQCTGVSSASFEHWTCLGHNENLIEINELYAKAGLKAREHDQWSAYF